MTYSGSQYRDHHLSELDDTVAVGEGLLGFLVLRISHSSVVAAWRQREKWLRALGAEVTLASASKWQEGGGVVTLSLAEGERVIGLRTIGRHPCGFLYGPAGLWKLLRSQPHEVLDVHEEPYSLAAAEVIVLRYLALRRRPLVFYTAQNLHKKYSLPVRLAERAVLSSAAGAYACNSASASVLRAKGFRGILRVVPLGVDLPRASEMARPPGPRPGSASGLRVGCAGRLTPEKGFHVAISAVASEPSWSLHIAGDGPERAHLAELASQAGMKDRLELLGYCDREAMSDFYASIDVLAVPSLPTPGWQEQFGRVVVEAMAAGVPVVASASGALPEVMGDAGLLVPSGDPASLHDALRVVERGPSMKATLVAKGKDQARLYTWEAVARQQLALYEDVLGRQVRAEATADDDALPGLEVILVAYHRPDLVAAALGSLKGTSDRLAFPVLVVDNSSNATVRQAAVSFGATYLDAGRNLGFAGGVNMGLANLAGPSADVLLLNPDAAINARSVRHLQRRLHAEARLACAAPAQVGLDGLSQQVLWPFPTPKRAWLTAMGLGRLVASGDFLIGSVLLLNGKALAEVGSFDDSFFLYAEETDWQTRARLAGWGARLCPEITASHIGGATSTDHPRRRELLFAGGQERYTRKWHGRAGWWSTRTAVTSGALIRALLLKGPRRQAATRRALHYGVGPLRLAKLSGVNKVA